LSSISRRNCTGSFPAAAASSSTIVSTTKPVCEWPTERHQSTGTPVATVCRPTSRFGISYGMSATPSTDVGSIPSFTIIASKGVPATIDGPTMACFHATNLPWASTPASTRCTYMGR
jgi:hypothetical protein